MTLILESFARSFNAVTLGYGGAMFVGILASVIVWKGWLK